MRHSLPYRMLRKRPMKLSTTVILMVSAVLFSVLLVVHLIYFSQISDMTRDGLANKALAVARTLADSPEIRQGLQKKPQESGIQAIAEAVRKRNDLLFIVCPCKRNFVSIIDGSEMPEIQILLHNHQPDRSTYDKTTTIVYQTFLGNNILYWIRCISFFIIPY